jgi:DNA repair exonuclease SbcCD nuclease subunit
MTDIRLVHMADIHLGYTGSISLIYGQGEEYEGRYVREVDIEQAVRRLTEAIRDAQPRVDVVVIAGDLFHRSAPLPRAIAWAARMVNRLITAEIDVVIVDGNHETSSWRHTGSPTGYLAELGALVANGKDYQVFQGNRWHNPRLHGTLAVHALPYRAVLEGQFAGVIPISGCLNVLVTHGRIQGMEEVNTLGLATSHIPSTVISRGWDYVALGDSHFHRYQPIQHAPAYYAGSLEALNFGEATEYPPRRNDRNAVRGVIKVQLRPGTQAVLSTFENVGRRPVLRLKAIEAADMDPETLMQALHDRLTAEIPREALVRLEVTACSIYVYERLDHEAIDRLRQQFRRCEIRYEKMVYPVAEQNGTTASETSLPDQWEAFIALRVGDHTERAWYLEQGQQRIESARIQIQGARLEGGEESEE